MVLQRVATRETGEHIYPRLWGVGPPGSKVSVRVTPKDGFGWTHCCIPVLSDGTWSFTITDQYLDLEGTGFTVEAFTEESSVILNDVAFGEVWLCSGQSNMEWTINGVRDAQQVKYAVLLLKNPKN